MKKAAATSIWASLLTRITVYHLYHLPLTGTPLYSILLIHLKCATLTLLKTSFRPSTVEIVLAKNLPSFPFATTYKTHSRLIQATAGTWSSLTNSLRKDLSSKRLPLVQNRTQENRSKTQQVCIDKGLRWGGRRILSSSLKTTCRVSREETSNRPHSSGSILCRPMNSTELITMTVRSRKYLGRIPSHSSLTTKVRKRVVIAF